MAQCKVSALPVFSIYSLGTLFKNRVQKSKAVPKFTGPYKIV